MGKTIVTIGKLTVLAAIALIIDFLFFAFTKTCGNCAGFQSYLASAHSLFTPTWSSLVLLLGIKAKKKAK